MGTRLRQSSGVARLLGMSCCLFLAGAALIGLLAPPVGQSASDRNLTPLAWVGFACLLLLAVRGLFIGIYLHPKEVRVRSWLRTYRIPIRRETRFTAVAWTSALTRWQESRWVSMISVSVAETGSRRRSFSATGVRPTRAAWQCKLLNDYVHVAVESPSVAAARDFARGTSWRQERDAARTRRTLPGRHSAEVE